MTGTGPSPPPELQLYDFMAPGLTDGTYTIEAEHAVAVGDAPAIPPVSRKFTVQGPRFALDPSEVHAVYPPANATGPFARTLPHVVLSTRTLPWERTLANPGAGADAPPVPWLALLAFDAGELPTTTSPSGAMPVRVAQLRDGSDAVSVPDLSGVSDAEGKRPCQAIEVDAPRFAAIVPHLDELRHLAHVRHLDATGQPGADPGDAGWFSLVVANRFPSAGRTIVHLVSLEGHDALLAGTEPAKAHVRLVSLASWSFTSTPADGNGESFKELALGLARPAERTDLALGLPFDEQARTKLPATDPTRRVADRLADGYVPVSFHPSTGEDTFAWYRGPLSPVESAAVAASARPYADSSQALVSDEATGVLDISLATAWEVGRAMALADRRFTTELMRFRRGAHRLVDLVLAGLESAHLDTPDDLSRIAKSGLVEKRFLDRLHAGLAGSVADAAAGAPVAPQQPSAAAAALPDDPVDAVKALLERDELRALVEREVADDLKPIETWLGELRLLRGVPFAYLVAHPGLLPPESARFFRVDANWLGAAVDGALSISVQSRRDSWFHEVVQGIVADGLGEEGVASGMLVRSALVSGWPGLVVSAQDAETLRMDRLADDVLLCLFAGRPKRIALRAPRQGLHFGVEDDGTVELRGLAGTVGAAAGTTVDVNDHWRAAGDRVLDMTSLVGGFEAKLGTPVRPADVALQMLWAPEQITFERP